MVSRFALRREAGNENGHRKGKGGEQSRRAAQIHCDAICKRLRDLQLSSFHLQSRRNAKLQTCSAGERRSVMTNIMYIVKLAKRGGNWIHLDEVKEWKYVSGITIENGEITEFEFSPERSDAKQFSRLTAQDIAKACGDTKFYGFPEQVAVHFEQTEIPVTAPAASCEGELVPLKHACHCNVGLALAVEHSKGWAA